MLTDLTPYITRLATRIFRSFLDTEVLIVLVRALVLSITVLLGCGGADEAPRPEPTEPEPPPSEPTSPPPTPPPPPPPPPPPTENRVEPPFGSIANFDIQDDTFVDENGNHDHEAVATVLTRQTVSWTQNGGNIHRVEFSKVPEGVQAEDSQDLKPGNIWEFNPPAPGEYVFFCRYHEYMMDAKIIVEAR